MKKILLLPFLLVISFLSSSQVIQFTKILPIWTQCGMNNFQQTNDGGYILNRDAVPEADSVANISYGYLVKMDIHGQTQWIEKYAKNNYFVKPFDGNSVCQTNDSGYIIGTSQYLNSNPLIYNGSTSIYLIKTDVSGNFLWSKNYAGMGNSVCFCVKQTADLGYIVCGYTTDTILDLQYNYLLKTDSMGNPQWGKTYSEASSGQGGICYYVNQTSDGGYIVSGASYSGAFVMKTDNLGNIIWNNNFGTSGSDILYCAKQTYDGGYIAAGFGSAGGIILLKIDAAGSVQWDKNYSTPSTAYDEGFSVVEVPGGYTVLDFTNTAHVGLLKTDMSGNVQWAIDYPSLGWIQTSSLCKTTDGGYAFEARCFSFVHFSYVDGVEVVKTDSLGRTGCGDAVVNLTATVYSPLANPGFVVGTVSPSINVNTDFTKVVIADTAFCSGSSEDGIPNLSSENSISIFPNPTSGNFSLQLNSLNGKDIQIEIFDVLGQSVLEKKEENVSGNYSENFSLEGMSDGIYFVEVKVGGEIVGTRKIVKRD